MKSSAARRFTNFLKREALGLDIGARSVKVLKLERQGKRVVLQGCYVQDLREVGAPELPKGSLAAARTVDGSLAAARTVDGSLAAARSALSALVETRELAGLKTHASLSDAEVIRLDLNLPKMPRRDLELAIRNEVEGKIHFPIEESCYDFLESEGQGTTLKIEAFVSRKEKILELQKSIVDARLKAASVESEMLAVRETLEHNGYLDDNASHLLIDLGDRHTSIAHVKGRELGAISSLALGSSQLNEQLRGALNCDFREAEDIIAQPVDEIADAKARLLVLDHWQQLIQETQSALGYAQEASVSKPLRNIYVFGGASQNETICRMLGESFSMDVERIDPFKCVDILNPEVASDIALHRAAPLMSIAFGLALRGV